MHGYSPEYAASAEQIQQLQGTWWVAMTRPLFESRLASELDAKGAKPVLPLVERVRFEGNRKRHINTPLFPSYLFFCGDTEHRWEAGRSLATLQVIDVRDQGRLVEELAAVVKAVEFCPTLGTVKLGRGTHVQITKGPLMGLRGYVIGEKPGTVHLSLCIMGAAAQIEIEPEALEATGGSCHVARCPSCGFTNVGYATRLYCYHCDQCGYSFTESQAAQN